MKYLKTLWRICPRMGMVLDGLWMDIGVLPNLTRIQAGVADSTMELGSRRAALIMT